MTKDAVQALNDDELVQVLAWAQAEQKERVERRKRDAIAKIKALAKTPWESRSALQVEEGDHPKRV